MPAKHLKLKFEEFDYGFIYKRVREDSDERNPYWTVGRVALWPNGFYLGNHFEWRVPIDDENTLSVAWFFMRVPKGREPYVQDKVPTWVSPIKDENGRWISSHVINQDIIAWVGQGRIADRTKENIGASDMGIAMIRKRLFDDLDAIAQGQEPKAIIRNSNVARCVELPYLPEEGKRRRDHARGPRQISAAEGAPAGLPALLRPAAGGAPGVRARDGHRQVARRYPETATAD